MTLIFFFIKISNLMPAFKNKTRLTDHKIILFHLNNKTCLKLDLKSKFAFCCLG